MCSVALIIDYEDVETSVCLRGIGGTCVLPIWKGRLIALASFFKKLPGMGVFSSSRAIKKAFGNSST